MNDIIVEAEKRLQLAEAVVQALVALEDPEGQLPMPPGPELTELYVAVDAWKAQRG